MDKTIEKRKTNEFFSNHIERAQYKEWNKQIDNLLREIGTVGTLVTGMCVSSLLEPITNESNARCISRLSSRVGMILEVVCKILDMLREVKLFAK